MSYFGFLYPHKGIDELFAIADPTRHHLVLIGSTDETDPYHRSLRDRASRGDWAGKVTITGYLPADEAARILAASDAVVLPFRNGGGLWNTSLHGAALQGTFIVTTSQEKRGYDSDTNIFSASPGDISAMRQALATYAGRRNTSENINGYATWNSIAEAHMQMYRTLVK
jgi:glycosyltransferase involved in cell wall biosynthesis